MEIVTVEMKVYNAMIDQPVTNDDGTHSKIWKIINWLGDRYATDHSLDCPYFKKHMKIAADLGKQQELDADPKSILQIDFTGNLDRAGNIMLFILKKSKRSCFGLSTRTCEDFCQKNNPCKI